MKRILLSSFFLFLLFSPVCFAGEKNILMAVPYTVQAPDGKWSDLRFEDGCEEASTLMAVYWARNKKIDKVTAKKEILAMAAYEVRRFGGYNDTSASDTASRLLHGYFGFDKYAVKSKIVVDDIIKELRAGNIVIVPTNGQALKNPFFKQPGPDRHMLVIRGYDFEKNEFITNDPGTRRGEGYRYKKDILFKAIRNYPTGHKNKIIGNEKVMIVVTGLSTLTK